MRIRVQNMTNTSTSAQVVRYKTWSNIVFYQTSLSLSPGGYSTISANLEAELSSLKTSGMPVVTVS